METVTKSKLRKMLITFQTISGGIQHYETILASTRNPIKISFIHNGRKFFKINNFSPSNMKLFED